MNWTERRERLRAIVAGPRCIYPASVYDGISARIATELGFEAMMFAGSVGSFSVLAAPDLCVLTLTEFADQAYRINRAGSLPLCVDADHGYGNALSVKRTVEELETAGVSALTIEDTLLPAPFGGSGAELIAIDEGVGKMRAALAGRQDNSLIVVGRTGAIGITGVDDTIARLRAYEAAGVDMLFIGGVPDDLMDLDYLSARNVRVCLQGHQSFWGGVQGVYDTLKALRDGARPAALKNIAPAELQKTVLRQADYGRWSKEFLGGA
jgi:carboxyvinyl-carboxyphosphonate phosphorylmutase